MKHPNQTLSEQIEQLVREHMEATRKSAASAVERAFATAPAPPRAKARDTSPRAAGRRRTRAELAELGERLYDAVHERPGETMASLAPTLGETASDLHNPMMALKRAGRVRAVGKRHQTRYYPAIGAQQ